MRRKTTLLKIGKNRKNKHHQRRYMHGKWPNETMLSVTVIENYKSKPWWSFITPTGTATFKKVQSHQVLAVLLSKWNFIHCRWEYKVEQFWKTIWQLLRKWNIYLPYEPGVSLLDSYPWKIWKLMSMQRLIHKCL